MKTMSITSIKEIFISLVLVLLTTIALGQGNNWKLSLNNNAGANDGIGTKNNVELKFFSNNVHGFSLTPLRVACSYLL